MQSIKNTSVAVMLLFLSYGVYQVIMKPLPTQTGDNVDLLAVSDPATDNLTGDSAMKFNLFGNGAKKQSDEDDTIPQRLLEISQPANLEVKSTTPDPPALLPNSNFVGLDKEFLPPRQTKYDLEPRYPAQAASVQQDFNERFSDENSSFPGTNQFANGTLTPKQLEAPLQESRELDSDLLVIPVTGMTDIAPRTTSANVQTEFIQDTQLNQAPLSESWPRILALVENEEFQTALVELSKYYHVKDHDPRDHQQMLDWLDALAAKVIYSSEHHLRSVPYIIQPDDTIASLARQWQVPAQLIYNVNNSKIPDPNDLEAGVEIKLIQGPFDAEVDTAEDTMTLFLDNMYAGRFKIGGSANLTAGEFSIVDKSAQERPDRPFWISLNNGSSIYASEGVPAGENEIALVPREAEEVFSILSASSKVRILR